MITAPKTRDIQDILYKYLDEGWHLFPVKRDKTPYLKGGFHNCTQTQGGVNQFLKDFPGCNWAGWLDHQFIVDIDVKRCNGFESLKRLEDKFQPLSKTRTHRSPSLPQYPHIEDLRGEHHIYIQQKGYSIPKADPITKDYPGVDLQAIGGYIVLPPSQTDQGQYAVIDDSPIIEAPIWLCDFTLECKAKEIGTKSNVKPGELIPQGQQDHWLFSRARGYRARGDTEEMIIEKLKIDLIRCPQNPSDPYTFADLQRIAQSACNYSINENKRPAIRVIGGARL